MNEKTTMKGLAMDLKDQNDTQKGVAEAAAAVFDNKSNNDFAHIDTEEQRVYTFAIDGKSVEVKIVAPLFLSVSASGGHRLFDAALQSHYIPPGWIKLSWTTRQGHPHFVK